MADAKYDALVIGAGHNGLCLAAYLARAGLSVAVFERRYEEGSGVNTEEATVPGFYHNMHAQYMEFIDIMPFYHDFRLGDLGARMIYPKNQCGITFADGRPPLIIHNPDYLDQTYRSIARYSKEDAERFCDMKRKVMEHTPLIAMHLYNPPMRLAPGGLEEGPLAELVTQIGLEPYMMLKSPKVIIDEIFETPELRALLYRECVEWGTPIDNQLGGFGFLISVLWLIGIWKLSVGGTHTLAHAMKQACLREGVTFRENSHVAEILVRNKRAMGIRLKEGTEIEAGRLVASNADVRQTFFDLVGKENLSDLYIRRVKNFRYGPSHVLATTAFALHEAPDYKSARHDPAINETFYTVVGFETPEEMADYIRTAYSGKIPERPGAGTWVNSLWDPTYAPMGKHAMNGWFFFPPADCLTPGEWDEVRATYNGRFLRLWHQYAANMTPANVVAHAFYTPFDMEQKNMMQKGDFSNGAFALDQTGYNRPFPEASHYRTEIEGLYLCGPSCHPGGGVHAACGYNAFKVIAEDYGFPKLWEKSGRGY